MDKRTVNLKEDERNSILDAAKTGNLTIIQKYEPETIQSVKDGSGCTVLHWACGNNHLPILHYLIQSKVYHPDIAVTSRKAKGRTPLHYACRNGHLEIVQTLVETYQANTHARAKHGVTPFQLAIWQNQLEVCQYLTQRGNIVPKNEVNDFGCGIIHWMGIAPSNRSEGIVKLAKWIFDQDGIDIRMKQSQGRTVLHKASWGGHFDLVKYLHEEHGMFDDVKDNAGNYAADLCDMANTTNHNIIASYLRKDCSLEYLESCNVLGLDRAILLKLKKDDDCRRMVRNAYISKARSFHPDRKGDNNEFQAIKKAYDHLMAGGAAVQQKNPMHSIHLMLEVQKNNKVLKDFTKAEDGMKLFKPRLISVLLEYGEKGISLSNIPKVWDKVWPQSPFPAIQHERITTGTTTSKRRRRKGELLRFIQDHAGDIVNVIRTKEKGIMVAPKNISHKDVAQLLSEQFDKVEIT